ncbi:regulator of G-protein signaling 22 isoform X3 [Girardinichthys multiradiatus]|uniref:regulator of G-protein signaling 22 isoform X3 n=1 Tax=Girardinichthys multiradiatus TaxID=208333 RepID=UPI001FAC7360|nr:regulator of G-protein signaling 22 isoform X3 [Girardinichthys multiradiatus]
MCEVTSAEIPHLTDENIESYLASDSVLVYYFNEFLRLPSFSEALVYNQESGLFEVVNGAAQLVSKRITTALKLNKNLLVSGDLAGFSCMPPPDNHYSVCSLDKKEGIRWIKGKRLPFFLQSDCYHEYRLTKLLFQGNPNFCSHERKNWSDRATCSASELHCRSWFKENVNALQVLHSLESISAKQVFSDLECEQTQVLHSSSGLSAGPGEPHCPSMTCDNTVAEKQLKHLADKVVNQVLKDAVNILHTQRQAETSEWVSKSGHQSNLFRTGKQNIQHTTNKDRERLDGKKETLLNDTRRSRDKPLGVETGRRVTNQRNPVVWCWQDTCCYKNWPCLDEFKDFLQGTPAEKLLNLWIDIERLRAMQQIEQKNRYLVLMRSRYLLSSSPSCLNVELLSRMGLTTSPCWTEEKLCSVQALLTEPLLNYWLPRFWTSQCVRDVPNVYPQVGLWTETCCYCPLSGRKPCGSLTSLHGLKPEVYLSPFPHPNPNINCPLPFGRKTEQMLQCLLAEFRTGLYFTHFCEHSGNQLWVNAIYFWRDLQNYHKLFSQDGQDPYRVQREAQLLYSTYIFNSARRSINVNAEVRMEVYNRMLPAFEELFNGVEEHALDILLEPWTLLIKGDKESFQQVCVQEEVRCIDSPEYRELQRLNKESDQQLRQNKSMFFPSSIAPSPYFSKGSQVLDAWSRVSPIYQGYRLGSILRQHHEIGHFMAFLQKHKASIHLMCWLDLEQYRRTSKRDKTIRQEWSSQIALKYLNNKYLFGPDSPATAEQQNDILRSAGGQEALKTESLSNPVVMEIQEIIRNHIEETWLPLFLCTTEFSERQKNKEKRQTAERFSQHIYYRSRARKGAWKPDRLWMSCSKEILLFRRTLLDPSTCQQFQHFVSLKGDFLENDVRFWVEVQRYKDLCHSHSSLAVIQQKVSTIINCFINSSMPPALQIDISPDQAQRILEKRHELGPYIFREAQISVFSELLKFWPTFQELSRGVCKRQLLPLLQEKRAKYKAKERRRRRREEENDERRAQFDLFLQEELERQESCFRDEENETDKSDDELEQEGINEKNRSRSQSGALMTPPTKPLFWSYSKYMAALNREEVLLRRQNQLEDSFSTASDSFTDCSIKSGSNRQSYQLPSNNSSKQFSRHNKHST